MDAAIAFYRIAGAALHFFWNKDLKLRAAIAFTELPGAAIHPLGTHILHD